MRLYYEIAVRSFRRATQYRTAFIAGMLTNAFFAAVRSFVYIALFAAGGTVAGFTLQAAISYVWATQALISIGGGWLAMDMAATVRSGDVITDMSRPWSFYGYWFSRSVGDRVCNLLLRGSVTYLLGMLYFRAHIPTLDALLAFVVSVAFALVLSFALSFLVNLAAFWLLEISGLVLIVNTVQMFFSGFLLPIDFFPPWLAAIARALPFQGISGLPAQILLGQLSGTALLAALTTQLAWSVAMTTAALLLTRLAVQKVVVQGG